MAGRQAAHRAIKRWHGAASLLADVRDPLLAFGAAREAARVIPSCDGPMPRGFHPLIAAQFCAALADNALLIVGIALLQAQGQPGWLAPMLKFCATLSYVLLAASNRRSSPASAGRRPRPGWLDRLSKGHEMRFTLRLQLSPKLPRKNSPEARLPFDRGNFELHWRQAPQST